MHIVSRLLLSRLQYIWKLTDDKQICIKLHMYLRFEYSLETICYNSSFIVEHYIGSSGDQLLN